MSNSHNTGESAGKEDVVMLQQLQQLLYTQCMKEANMDLVATVACMPC
jgi:hypothetical protein